MAATALLRFRQGTNIGAAGQALKGVLGQAVTVENSDNVDVASWQIDLVYVDPASSISPATPYAYSDNGGSVTTSFTPDVRGSYRLVLKVWGVPGRIGVPADEDIRIFAIPEENGLVVPPPQLWPLPLPPVESGTIGAKASEFNFGGQPHGWAGSVADDGLIGALIRRVDGFTSGSVASSLKTATGIVAIGSAEAPLAGEVLVAQSGAAATWQILPGVREGYFSLVSGLQGSEGPYTLLGTLPDTNFSSLGAGTPSFRVEARIAIPAASTARARLYDATNHTTLWESDIVAGPQSAYPLEASLTLGSGSRVIEFWLATPTSTGGLATCSSAGLFVTFS